MTYKGGETNYNENFLINLGYAMQSGVWAYHSTSSDLFFVLGCVLEKIHVINGSGMKESNQAFQKRFDLVLLKTYN